MREDLVKRLKDYEESGLDTISPYEAGNIADAIEELRKSKKRGRWIKPVRGDGGPYCSECKGVAMTSGGMFPLYLYTLFCPSCGAEMENASVLLGRADNE